GDHWLNNQRLVLAYAQAAAAVGVELNTGTNVSRLIVEGGKVRALVTEGGRVDGDVVLLAAGAWSAELMAPLGAPLRTEPRRRSGDPWLNNQRLVLAYAQAAAAVGVELNTGTNVSRLIVEGGKVRALVTEGGRVDGDVVLLAAGAWSAELMAPLGAPLRIEPRRGQMIALAHVPPVLPRCVHGEAYVALRPSGELIIGA